MEYFQQSLLPELTPLGYKGKFVAAPGGGAIGVATLWNTGTFKLLKVRSATCGFQRCESNKCIPNDISVASHKLFFR